MLRLSFHQAHFHGVNLCGRHKTTFLEYTLKKNVGGEFYFLLPSTKIDLHKIHHTPIAIICDISLSLRENCLFREGTLVFIMFKIGIKYF